jgi:adenine-specific DNA methylase
MLQLSLFPENTIHSNKFPTTRYQGSKQRFVDWIWKCIKDIPFNSALDAFGGTGSVSFRLKEEGKEVTYNDILIFNHIIGKALIENTNTTLSDSEVKILLSKHRDISYPDFIERTFKDIYYTDEENRWLDVVSTNIRNMENPYKQAIAYFALFQSCIIKRPYNLFHRKNLYVRLKDVERSFGNKKTWDTPFETHFRKFVSEANNAIFDNKQICRSINKDVFDINKNYDFVYIDTPYINENGVGIDYYDFYHFLNGLVNYENWNKHIDYTSKHLRLFKQSNVWTNTKTIYDAFKQLFSQFKESVMAISYRSNGTPTINELIDILEGLNKKVEIYHTEQMKYVLSKKESTEILIIAR